MHTIFPKHEACLYCEIIKASCLYAQSKQNVLTSSRERQNNLAELASVGFSIQPYPSPYPGTYAYSVAQVHLQAHILAPTPIPPRALRESTTPTRTHHLQGLAAGMPLETLRNS
jgi:hypothetical protein